MNDDHRQDSELENAYASLSRAQQPTAGFTDRVLDDLAKRGLVRSPRRRLQLIAAALVVFAAGIATGLGTAALLGAPSLPRSATPSVAAQTILTTAPTHVVGRTEVWF